MLRRYAELIRWVDIVRPRSIIEVGAWNGEQAVRMIRAAAAHFPQITYTGYDMFDLGDAAFDAAELNGKSRVTQSETRARLEQQCPAASITLVKGNTNDTLRDKVFADFVYIDGGHSVETIANDYRACADCPVVVLDDYYFNLNPQADIDTARFGCNTLIDALAASGDPDLIVGTFPTFDYFDHLGGITMAFVVRRSLFPERLLVARSGAAGGYAPPSKDELIDSVYRGLLGRAPDAVGKDIWLERLDTRSVENMLRDFVNTAEFHRWFNGKCAPSE